MAIRHLTEITEVNEVNEPNYLSRTFDAEELLNDPDFLLAAIANNPWALALAPAEMQRDRDFLLKVPDHSSTNNSFDE